MFILWSLFGSAAVMLVSPGNAVHVALLLWGAALIFNWLEA